MLSCPILVGSGGGSNPYITTTNCYSVNGVSTSITGNIYAQTGDIILATVMYRDANTMVTPIGWTSLFNSDITKIDATLNHRFGFFKKHITTNGNLDVTFTQTTSQRIMLNLITVKNANDLVYRSNYTQYVPKEATNRFVDLVNKTNENTKLIWGATSALWYNNNPPYGLWQTNPNDVSILQISDYQTSPRLCNIIDLGNGSVIRSVKPNPLPSGSALVSFGIAAVEII